MGIEDNFKKGVTELVVLHLLCTGDKYGYNISQELTTLSEGKFKIQEGSLYPTLYRLEKGGYVVNKVVISEENQRLRKYYSITELGKEYLLMLLDAYKKVNDGVAKILDT